MKVFKKKGSRAEKERPSVVPTTEEVNVNEAEAVEEAGSEEEVFVEADFDAAAEVAALRAEIAQLRAELAEATRQAKADDVNGRNRVLTAGKLSAGSGEVYFTPDEVRAMDRRAVRDNYEQILRSMKHWH